MQLAVLPIGEYIYFQADNLGAFANPVAAEQLVRACLAHSSVVYVLGSISYLHTSA